MKSFKLYSSLLMGALMVALCPTQGQARDLKTDVTIALQRDFLQPFQISVKAPGNVEIKGMVPTYTEKLEVYKDVAQVPGVEEISDLVDVQPALVSDAELEANIQTELALDKKLAHPEKIRVGVDHGTVFLEGSVNTPLEAAEAQRLAGWVPGVRSISNQIQALYAAMPNGTNSTQVMHPKS